jgi:hypothetical protein
MKILVVGSSKRDFHVGFDTFVLGLAKAGFSFDHYPNILTQSHSITGTYGLNFDIANISYPTYSDVLSNLKKKKYDLIITLVSGVDYKGGKHGILSYATRRLKYSLSSNKHRLSGTLLVDWMKAGIKLPPFIVIDDLDDPFIWPRDFELLLNCKLYFKRELPFNRFFCFRLFGPLLNKDKRQFIALSEKIRPIWVSYDINSISAYTDINNQIDYADRDVDIVLLFNYDASYTRPQLLSLVDDMAKKWKVVSTKTGRLSKSEFYEVAKRTKIAVSPDGRGWDCPKHYEFMFCGALPFFIRPTIKLAYELKDGENCVFIENNLRDLFEKLDYYLSHTTLSANIAQESYDLAKNKLGNDMLAKYVLNTYSKV